MMLFHYITYIQQAAKTCVIPFLGDVSCILTVTLSTCKAFRELGKEQGARYPTFFKPFLDYFEGNVGISYGRGIWLSPQLGPRLLSIADVNTPHAQGPCDNGDFVQLLKGG